MSDRFKLEQQTRLQQRLNPQQVVFGRYLEMTAPEIEDEVRRALDENPALEVVDEGDSASDVLAEDDFTESSEQLQRADYADEDDMPAYDGGYGSYYSETDPHEIIAASEQASLREVLLSQLADVDIEGRERLMAEYVIGNLDDNGYMTRSISDIADDMAISEGESIDVTEVKKVFTKIRELDPAGVGAVDLRDCLLLQIKRYPHTLTTKIAEEIVADWFDLFSKKHFDQLRSHLGIDGEQLSAALDFIKGLNPKPGALVEGDTSSDKLRHIIPDFAVDVDNDGNIKVSLLNNVPELAIEESFHIDDNDAVPENRREAEARTFIKRRHDDASAFISMLKLRAQTLLAVMKAIAKIQHRFFVTDDQSAIKPMIIKDIAAMTGLDISVISRAAAGKYVLTAHGMYPLKMFFNERPKDDTDASSHEIVAALSKIIENEDKRRPLSDEALKDALVTKGYDIARRTVTKYRERLGEPVARLRKQYS